MAQDAIVHAIAGKDAAVGISDSSGNTFRFIATSGNLTVTKNGSLSNFGLSWPVAAKTASYTVTQAESGTLFTTTGASGTVTFTLPAAPTTGTFYRFFNTENQTMTVTAGTADTMAAIGNSSADSIAFSTSSKKQGAGLEVIYDGALWICFPFTWNDGTNVSQATITDS